MKSTVLNIFFGFLLTFAISFSAFADEVTEVIDDVAAKLVQQLPMDKKIALKSLSPDETGLPEDFLRKLTSDLEAALLTASDFEMNLANRATMEDVWQEAVEFNNADFDELFKSANADVMLMMSPRAISTGVEIVITAYALTGSNVGKTLASSGSVLLPIDLQANLGVDLNTLDDRIDRLVEQSEKVESKADIEYVEYQQDPSAFDPDDLILALVNGRRFIAFETDMLDRLVDQRDIDNDGYLDAVVYSHAGGNGAAPDYSLVSYRGDGNFSTHELTASWRAPEFIPNGNEWKIRFRVSGQGAGYGTLDDGYQTFLFAENSIADDKTSVGQTFSEIEVSFNQAYDALQEPRNGDTYAWMLDIDFDGRDDLVACSLWVRWGYLQDCIVQTNDGRFLLEYAIPHPTLKSPQCKVIGFSRSISKDTIETHCDYEEVVFSRNTRDNQSALSCAAPDLVATISNVQNFTNLRRQAGLNGQVIGQVPLGATVTVVSPGSYLRYDRCAASCEGSNQSAIKACVDNNDVWIEVQYNGRRGFLSRKFLE